MTSDPWAHQSAEMRCRTCMWFVVKASDKPDVKAGPDTLYPATQSKVGRCRRRAPTMSGYPVVFEDDWCGDHKLGKNSI